MFNLSDYAAEALGVLRRRIRVSARQLLLVTVLVLALSVVCATMSLYQVTDDSIRASKVIDTTFDVTPNETYRQGLGSFHGDENLTVLITAQGMPVNFTMITYGGLRYSNLTSSKDLNFTFPAGADYYEAVFQANATSSSTIHLEVFQHRLAVTYPLGWLGEPAKMLFIFSWGALILLFVLPNHTAQGANLPFKSKLSLPQLDPKNRRRLKLALLISLLFWLALLAVNVFPLATFENWYTDSARNTYSANLFGKVGFAVFDTPLSELSSGDASLFKFVTWPEMPHLYPLGSVFLYLPFGWLIEQGVSQGLVFKAEIALLLVVAHVCMYLFLKRFLRHNLDFVLKALVVYLLYIVLVVYSADGMFDTVAFLFSLMAVVMFIEERYDGFLLLVAVSAIFKYQAGIFLLPLVLVGLQRLVQKGNPLGLLRNKAVLVALGLGALSLFTAYLSLPYLATTRPELVMNGVNAFSPHAQVPWGLQVFAVLLTLAVTLTAAVYLWSRSRWVSVFMVFSLLPCFTMPYFQPWYLPTFFVYPLIARDKQSLRVTVAWLAFMVIVLSFGGLSFNPVHLLDNFRRALSL
jgi:hypothetical protein